jgi:hypothetical protein
VFALPFRSLMAVRPALFALPAVLLPAHNLKRSVAGQWSRSGPAVAALLGGLPAEADHACESPRRPYAPQIIPGSRAGATVSYTGHRAGSGTGPGHESGVRAAGLRRLPMLLEHVREVAT